MQINKKIFTVAITALLLLSILAIAVPANAIATVPFVTGQTNHPNTSVVFSAGSTATGPVGSRVMIVGNATSGVANAFSTVTAYWDTLSGPVLGTAGADNLGQFAINVTIPSAINGAHFIVVNDGAGAIGAPFTVNASLSRGITSRALGGDTLTLTGNGYNVTSAVTVRFIAPNTTTTIVLTAPTITTNATGSFSALVTVPATITAADFGATDLLSTWNITATDASGVVNAVTIILNYYITVAPVQGPPGITLTIAGRIPASTAVSVTFATATAFTTTSDANGRFTGTYSLANVPLVLATAYTITATWGPIATPVSRTTTFTTNAAAPAIVLGGAVGQVGQVITITGSSFSFNANITLTFGAIVVNSTVTDSRFGPTGLLTGAFSAGFAVPNLAVGAYTATVTDQFGASATSAFTIVAAPVTTITTAAFFAQGDTISFSITTTDITTVTSVGVYIKDPSGIYWWGTPAAPLVWTTTTANPTTKVVLYTSQVGADLLHLTLPANAPTGSWNWTVAYTPSVGTVTTATGLFTVVTGGVTGITTQITALNATIAQLTGLNAKIDSITGSIATLTTSMGTVTTSVNSLSSSISSISSGVATIQTSLGTVTTSLSSIDAVLGAVAGDTATLKTSVGTITTSLASIGTQVTSISGNVATIQTDLGTLKGTVTSISGNVATIQTDLGTIKADVSSSKTATDNLSPLVIVAIVLALIAAIAAIASIVLMRRKIAG